MKAPRAFVGLSGRFVALVALLAGCSNTPTGVRCRPGFMALCDCPGLVSGTQVCNDDGTYTACQCPAAPDASPRDVVTADQGAQPDGAADVVDVAKADVDDAATEADVDDAATEADATLDAIGDAPDSTASDAAADAATGDAPDATAPTMLCEAGSVVDLNVVGTRMSTVTSWRGENRSVPLTWSLGDLCARSVAPAMHRYTTRTASRVTVSTQNLGTAEGFDTVLAVTDLCGVVSYGSGVSLLACNDDAGGGGPLDHASALALPSVPAGTTLYISVSGAASAARPRNAYALTVTEAPLIDDGAPCDRLELANACRPDRSCTASDPSVCARDGTLGAACLTSYPACGAGLGCVEGRCVTAATGAGCSPVCPSTSTCRMVSGVSQCVPFGGRGAPCRPDGVTARCDAGLRCSPAMVCVPTVAVGASCDEAGAVNTCAEGATCVGGACLADGSRGGACRQDLTQPLCDGALECSNECLTCDVARCEAPVARGESCEPAGGCAGGCVLRRCVTGSSCRQVGGLTGHYFCVADGVAGAPCRRSRTQPPCDEGLTCAGGFGVCLRAIASGEACEPSTSAACVAGTVCADVSGVMRCAPAPYAESSVPSSGAVDACAVGRVEPLATTSPDANYPLAPLEIPFPFRYYGVAQTRFVASTGALGRFGVARPTGSAYSFRAATTPDNVVAPYMMQVLDGLQIGMQSTGSRICTATVGTAPDRRFVVEWSDMTLTGVGAAMHLTFEVVMHEGSDALELYYLRLDPTTGPLSAYTDGVLADIGLTGPAGQPMTIHRGPVTTTAGVRFTPR